MRIEGEQLGDLRKKKGEGREEWFSGEDR